MGTYQSLQGNLGLGKAIQYFTTNSIPVSLPLNDTQGYDLVVDYEGVLKRVQVKTTQSLQSSGGYAVQLRNTGGEAGSIRKIPFDNSKSDLLFIYTASEQIYIIPTEKVTATNSIIVGNKYTEYLVEEPTFQSFIQRSNNQ